MSMSIGTAKRTNLSADRNSLPIANALLVQMDSSTSGLHCLEIASGTGQHASYLAPLFPNITFQPTEKDFVMFASIAEYAYECPTKNLNDPFCLDISAWETCQQLKNKNNFYDYMLNINMMHITKFECAAGLFRAAGKLLKPCGSLYTYGPYAINGILAPESNVQFDASLRNRNPDWGVRDINEVQCLATRNGLNLSKNLNMPANNKLLTWVKQKTNAASS